MNGGVNAIALFEMQVCRGVIKKSIWEGRTKWLHSLQKKTDSKDDLGKFRSFEGTNSAEEMEDDNIFDLNPGYNMYSWL